MQRPRPASGKQSARCATRQPYPALCPLILILAFGEGSSGQAGEQAGRYAAGGRRQPAGEGTDQPAGVDGFPHALGQQMPKAQQRHRGPGPPENSADNKQARKAEATGAYTEAR